MPTPVHLPGFEGHTLIVESNLWSGKPTLTLNGTPVAPNDEKNEFLLPSSDGQQTLVRVKPAFSDLAPVLEDMGGFSDCFALFWWRPWRRFGRLCGFHEHFSYPRREKPLALRVVRHRNKRRVLHPGGHRRAVRKHYERSNQTLKPLFAFVLAFWLQLPPKPRRREAARVSAQ